MRRLIGLGHYSRTGKDTVAAILQRKLGGPQKCLLLSWADPLKDVCRQLFHWAGVREAAYYDTPDGARDRDVILPRLGLTPIELWVKFGTPLVRDQIHPDTWIELGLKRINDHLTRNDHWCIVRDVRFPNEAAAIRHEDGVLIEVSRPGVSPRDTVADLALLDYDDWDFRLHNNGSLMDLDRAVDFLLAEFHRADGSGRIIEATPVETEIDPRVTLGAIL